MANMINIRTQVRYSVSQWIKYGKYNGYKDYPVTEGYLKFLFREITYGYQRELTETQLRYLYLALKQEIEIDEDADDNWSEPDDSFEEAIKNRFIDIVKEIPALKDDAHQLRITFLNFLVDVVMTEQILYPVNANWQQLFEQVNSSLEE